MSEYNDIGRPESGARAGESRPENIESLKPGTLVRVYSPVRNNPTEHTVYAYQGLVDTPEGKRAKLAFKAPGGKIFVRIAHPDDLILA